MILIKSRLWCPEMLRWSITKTACLIRWSWDAAISLFEKGKTGGETGRRQQDIEHLSIMNNFKDLRLSHLMKQIETCLWLSTYCIWFCYIWEFAPDHQMPLFHIKPLITDYHQHLCAQWGMMKQWKRLVWTDESQFLLHHTDGHMWVCF